MRSSLRRALPTLTVALLTIPVCSSLTARPAPALACLNTVPPPLGMAHDGSYVSLPEIPKWVPSQVDSVQITFVHHLTCNDEKAVGCFTYDPRGIQLEDTLSEFNRWIVLRHEIFHSAMFDAGLRFRVGPDEDRVADAIAAQQVREMAAGWPQ